VENKEKFIGIFNDVIKRNGKEKLLECIEKTDFFTAPASTKYHGAYAGGLVEHSLNVFDRMLQYKEKYSLETLAIVSLMHDLCKADYYAVDYKNVKQPDGSWEKEPYYTVNDKLPIGNHGDKSVFIIQRFMPLSAEEVAAIRYHMGAYQEGDMKNLSKVYEKYPLAYLLHSADMEATYFDEKRGT
jgi:HD superfamily phosphohydrolase YqeK